MNPRTTGFAVVRALPKYPTRVGGIAFAVFLLGALVGASGHGWRFAVPGFLAFTAVTAWWAFRQVLRPQGTRGRVARESDHAQRSGGVASWLDIQERASATELRRRATVLRPSLAGVRNVKPTELGALIATTGTGRLPGQQVWTSCEDVTVRIGGPRRGKTLSLACHGLDAPGPLLTTSTRSDLAEHVHMARQDRAVHVMNPTGYASIASTVRWSVLLGCDDYATAARRASDLVPDDHGLKDSGYWSAKARDLLALLLHAAALDGKRARDILRWATAEPNDKAVARLIDVLANSGPGGPERAWQIRQHYAEAANTRKSVVATLSPALAWLADDHARPLGDAELSDCTLDVERFLLDSETLHLIAGVRSVGGVPNLISAIVAEVAYQARQMSGDMPGGRLDPPLTMLLDEAALIAPVPLPRWSADSGGRNITLHVSLQSLSQLRERWGNDGAGTILSNAGALIAFGGSNNAAELKELSDLTGETRQRILDADGKKDLEHHEHRWVPVLSAAQVRALRAGEVLVMRHGLAAVVGWAPLVVKRRGWTSLPLPSAVTIPATTEALTQPLDLAEVTP